MRLIDKDALFETLVTGDIRETHQFCYPCKKVLEAIDAQATVEPQRMKGRWIYGEHDIAMCDGYRCDKCGFFVPWDYKFTFIDFINDYHFCPNCGSDMRGEDDESN